MLRRPIETTALIGHIGETCSARILWDGGVPPSIRAR